MTAKRILVTLAGGLILLCLTVALVYTDWTQVRTRSSAEELRLAAQSELPHLLQLMQNDSQSVGLTKTLALDQLQLGDPYPVYILDLKRAVNYEPRTQPNDVLDPTGSWQFPVLIDGKVHGVATFEGDRHRLQLVAATSESALAQRLVTLHDRFDHADTIDSMKLVGVPQLGLTLLLAYQDTQPVVVFPSGLSHSLSIFDPAETYRPDEVFPILGQQAEQTQGVLP